MEPCHTYGMAIRTTVDLPEPLHAALRQRSAVTGQSMRKLIVNALEASLDQPKKGKYVTGPMISVKGKLGPAFPIDKNPHDLILP